MRIADIRVLTNEQAYARRANHPASVACSHVAGLDALVALRHFGSGSLLLIGG